MATTCYKVGDYAYFEVSPSSPYAIRRIEELIKANNGIEARVMCFYRRREIPSTLLQLADKHQSIFDDENDVDRSENYSSQEKYQLKLKELFLSRQYETLPISQIRGRCTVYLLHETEDLLSYLQKPDTFFYSLVYEPHQKTLLADRGEIRVGPRFQAEVTSMLPANAIDTRNLPDLETLIWDPNNLLTDTQIDQFMIITRSVGTFARALDSASSVKQPSLHLSVACASRDSTLIFSLDTLHKSRYDISLAISRLVPSTGPVLCRDEMEAWSTAEANLFEEALEKYGKDFMDIRRDFFPWKSLRSIVEYYYMWKTTDRYVQQRRLKAIEEEKRLKEIQLPSNKSFSNPHAIENQPSGKPCESCNATQTSQWYTWGSTTSPSRLCSDCYNFWKTHGGLKQPPIEGERQGLATQLTDLQYPCTECNKVFHRQERLFAHMSAHRPYKCNIQSCDKEFKMKSLLARHIASHHQSALNFPHPSLSANPSLLTSPLSLSNHPSSNHISSSLSNSESNNSHFNIGGHHYPRIILKTKAAFYLKTTPLTKLSRALCKQSLRLKHVARRPFTFVNMPAIKGECQEKILEMNQSTSPNSNTNFVHHSNSHIHHAKMIQNTKALYGDNNTFLNAGSSVNGDSSQTKTSVKVRSLQHPEAISTNSYNRKQEQPFQLLTDKNNRFHNKQNYLSTNKGKRSIEISTDEEMTDGKRIKMSGSTYIPKLSINIPQKRNVNSFIDAPDDLYFVANGLIRKMRRKLNQTIVKKSCRRMGILVGI
ncbi:unnamed protein product [Gordionus sp. m RMFG-2023]|uniref:metastasis-associated protein MTA3-like isoform X2 n=1 Tax=Gordionus sp. m RMFG-2023 TaxID=3053472 RepID=UPI0030DEEBEA